MATLSPTTDLQRRLDRLQEQALKRGIRLQIGTGLLASAAQTLTDWLPAGPWVLVCDPTTWELVGRQLADRLPMATVHQFMPRPSQDCVTAGDREEAELVDALQQTGATAAIAVGSGTVNDLTRAACQQCRIPYVVIPTAPSMNGYLSAGVALLVDGVKTTRTAPPPMGCLADTGVLTTAPAAMRGSGYADLRSRVTSCADWGLSHVLTHSSYVPAALDLVEEADGLVEGIAPDLGRGTPEATQRLMAGLLMSGLAMDMAGSSAPSSGAEHLVSHLLDMEHYAIGQPHDLHGRQVGVATLAIASMYEQLLALDPAAVDVRGLSARRPWCASEDELSRRFGALWPAVRGTARIEGLPDSQATGRHGTGHGAVSDLATGAPVFSDQAVGERLERFVEQSGQLHQILRASLRPADQLRQDLSAAGAPISFSELGVDRDRARRVLLDARHIRSRYTILDLAAELGTLEAWVDEALVVAAA